MTSGELHDNEQLRAELARDQNSLKSITNSKGLSTEWADLALALFNLKEFIYLR